VINRSVEFLVSLTRRCSNIHIFFSSENKGEGGTYMFNLVKTVADSDYITESQSTLRPISAAIHYRIFLVKIRIYESKQKFHLFF